MKNNGLKPGCRIETDQMQKFIFTAAELIPDKRGTPGESRAERFEKQ